MSAHSYTGAGSTNVGNPLTDPTVGTIMAWVYPTASAATKRAVFWKGDAASGDGADGYGTLRFGYGAGGAGRFGLMVDYSTKDITVESPDSFITANTWQFWGCTFDHTTNPPELFWGNLTTRAYKLTSWAAVPARSAGVGTRATEAGANAHIGNNQYQSGLDNRGSFSGRIAAVAWFPTILADALIIAHQLALWNWAASSPKGVWYPGRHKLTACPDMSGSGWNGTVAGSGVAMADGLPTYLASRT